MNKLLQKISILIVPLIMLSSILPVFATDTLEPSDFQLESWNKTIDFFDYVREYSSIHGKSPPPDTSHAYLNLAYVNKSGIRTLSAGLINITDEDSEITVPIQTTMMNYKSQDEQKDVVTASSFIMLMAFNETDTSIYSQSPDKNDTLYASFSLGYDLGELFAGSNKPDLNTNVEVIPLESSSDELIWTWGMKYTNLAAYWWKSSIDPNNPGCDPRPIALTVYDELTFTYRLEIDPVSGEATLSMNYTIGRMRDLWVFWWLVFLPVAVHYNSTGCYQLNGQMISDETIYDFLSSQGIKMSIVNFQASAILDHSAYFESDGLNVQDNEVIVDNSVIEAFADDGEKIFDEDFSVKDSYDLYNYTFDPQENTFETYQTVTRTAKIAGFARNPIFGAHTSLMRFIPTVLASMDPSLYEQAKDHLLDMSYADYFCITAYPEYDGYRIVHDPTITAYCTLTTGSSLPEDSTPFGMGLLLLVGVVAVIVVAVVLISKRRH